MLAQNLGIPTFHIQLHYAIKNTIYIKFLYNNKTRAETATHTPLQTKENTLTNEAPNLQVTNKP